MENFYEHLNIIFDFLENKYGLTKELIIYKSKLIEVYNKKNYYNNYKYSNITINENGYIC